MKNEKLRIQEVEVIFRDAQYAYIDGGLEEGVRIVTTNLTTVVDGAALRMEQPNTRSRPDTTANTVQQDQPSIQTSEAIR